MADRVEARAPAAHDAHSTSVPDWPPRTVSYKALLRRRPPIAPYLASDGVRRIGESRQLFVDDWLVHGRTVCHSVKLEWDAPE